MGAPMMVLGAIFPTKIGATCDTCRWTQEYVTVSMADHNTGQTAWTAAQAKVRRVVRAHLAANPDHQVNIVRIHYQWAREA